MNFIIILLKLMIPGGTRKITAENMALRQQLISLTRHRKRAPRQNIYERIIFGFLTAILSPKRLSRIAIAIAIKPATLLKFHRALVKRKYQLLFSKKTARRPGPKGPSQELIDAIVEMKRRNPRLCCSRLAMQISNAFGCEIDKDVVRRVLSRYFKTPTGSGPSWLTFIGLMRVSLWSIDFFRAESINLKSHWVMVIMDQFSRRIIGFSVHVGDLSGTAVCHMFNKVGLKGGFPKYLSTDNDPLYKFRRWKINLQLLDIEEIKSAPNTPVSHPFVERLIGSIRREFLDQTLFWNAVDLQRKLAGYQKYFNESRGHHGIGGITPLQKSDAKSTSVISLQEYRWEKHCKGLFQLPTAA